MPCDNGLTLHGRAPEDDRHSWRIGPCQPYDCPGSLGEAYHTHGARIFNMSWGFVANDYTSEARDIDKLLLLQKDAMVFISIGNAGRDDEPDGIPDEFTMGTPATAAA